MRSRLSSWNETIAKLGFKRKKRKNYRKNSSSRTLRVESLEPRQLLTTFYVDNLDDGTVNAPNALTGSLRQAIYDANNSAGIDEIVIRVEGELPLTAGQLTIQEGVTIKANGSDKFTIDGNDLSRVFYVNSGVDATISDLTITGGKTTGTNHGAGIYNAGDLTLDHVNVVDNHAYDSGQGGGLYALGSVTMVDSSFENNTSFVGGGARVNATSTNEISISNSTFANNTSATSGGGLWIWGASNAAPVVITNSTFSGNEAGTYSGGLRASNGGTVSIINSTITDNTAGTSNGGLASAGSGINASVIVLHNSIIAGNHDPGTTTTDAEGNGYGGSSYNLVGITTNGFLNNTSTNHNVLLGTDPLKLAPLGNYGGPTKTHALLNGSSAIDKASTTIATNYGLLLDQRGKNRSVNMSVPDGSDGYTDIGAYETGNDYTLLVTTSDDESNSGYEANDLSLREALELTDDLAGKATITFDESLYASGATTLQLSQAYGELSISSNYVNIVGPGRGLLTIDANADSTNQYRLFNVSGSQVMISELTLMGGNTSGNGAAILGPNGGTLTLDGVRVTGHETTSSGGIIEQAEGNLFIVDSEIDSNIAPSGSAVRLGGLEIVRYIRTMHLALMLTVMLT
jgi:hypothetical protein